MSWEKICWEKIKDSLEPVARNFYINSEQDIQLSQAISLKRIADALEGKNIKQPIVMSAEEYAKYKKAFE